MLGGFYRCGREEKSLVGLLPLHLTMLVILETPLYTSRYYPATHCSALAGCSEGWQVTEDLLSSWSVRYSEIYKDWLHRPHLGVISLQMAEAPSEVLCDDFLQHPDREVTPR